MFVVVSTPLDRRPSTTDDVPWSRLRSTDDLVRSRLRSTHDENGVVSTPLDR
jgi:hypothetical protein